MASWKKVLVSGSSIEVNQITASGVPVLDNESNLLSINSDGHITQISQSNIAGTNPTFTIEANNAASITSATFDTAGDYLIFSHSLDHGFGFTHTQNGDTSSINLQTPQDLQTSAGPTFASLNISGEIIHDGDSNTKINFTDDQINFVAGNIDFLRLKESTGQDEVNINEDSNDIDFRVEGSSDANLLFTDAGEDKVAIGTDTVNAGSLLTVDGTIHTTGITASALPTNTDSITVIVDGGSGQLEKRDISSAISGAIDAATASLSSSITGTTNEIEVTGTPGNIVIGLTDNVTISNSLTVTNITASGNIEAVNISASGAITASNLRVDNDIALGGNIFSFSGFSFIEGVSANFTGSNKFGSGSTPSANDTAGGGVAHQFTGSVAITGSALTLDEANLTLDNGSITATNGSITANNGTGSFGYLTALEISSSGHLYASLSNDDSTITDAVVVYDNATGQFFTTASAGVGVTVYGDLAGIPANIVSGSSLSSPNQGEVQLTTNNVAATAVDLGLQTADSPQFTNLTLTGNLVATGSISASGDLFAKVVDNSSTDFKTVVYDTATGKFHSTGSYGGGGGAVQYADIANIPGSIVSASSFSSNNQGGVTASINGVSSSFDVGLTPTDSPTFSSITATGNISVAGTSTLTGNTTITGDLIVEGNTTTISTANLQIEDAFILLASGSAGDASLNDGGIIVEQTAAGAGVALYWDTSEQNWAIDIAGADHTSETGGVTADVNVVTVQLNANSGVAPTSSPIMGVDGNANEKGHFYVDTSDEFGLYVYT